MSPAIDGLLLVDKPRGPTSHDLVAAARRALGVRRIGHTGTLDPLASGLLVLAIGRATRLIRFVPHGPKVYSGTIVLGVRTDSDDISGARIGGDPAAVPGREAVLAAAARLVGRIRQVPPSVSAKKVAGRRAYALQRAGRPVALDPVEVIVDRFDLTPDAGGDPSRWEFEASVSAGTYIRSLARDLGDGLGCGGTLARLRRLRIGPFAVAGAIAPGADGALDPSAADRIIPLDRAPLAPSEVRLDGPGPAGRFVSGGALEWSGDEPRPGTDPYRTVRAEGGRLLGVGEIAGGLLRPRVVVAPRP